MVRAFAAAALTFVSMTTLAASKPKPQATEFHVGVTSRVFHPKAPRNWRQAKAQELRVTVWYPAPVEAAETQQVIGPPGAPLFVEGMASPHAPFAPALGKFPLIVLSHGSGGSAAQMAWLGIALARAGFIAAAVDHPGNNSTEPYTPEGFLLWWERATDMSEVIDGMLADEDIGPLVDRDRIGAAGFSSGAYTVLELGGARTDISVVYDHCRKDPNYVLCHTPEMSGMGTPDEMLAQVRKTSRLSLATSADSYRDPRVKSVVAIAPPAEMLTQESLRAMRLPVLLVVGGDDPIVPPGINADYVRANVRGAKEEVLPGGVVHYTFLDTCTAAGKEQLKPYCDDKPGVDRDQVHQRVADDTVDWFVQTLRVK